MNSFKSLLLIIAVPASLFFVSQLTGFVPSEEKVEKRHFHGKEMYSRFLPLGFNDIFAASGECAWCHTDQTTQSGKDVSIQADWRASMLANSSKDPYWRAKVKHETAVHPQHSEHIETTCSRCHAPQGAFNAFHNGHENYSFDELINDPVANDGVSCTACHLITDSNVSETFVGNQHYNTEKTVYGPYQNIFPNPMINHTGYTPEYSGHILKSELCASCHTLITPTIDLEGNITGNSFPEQATYHEWKNSLYSANDISCGTCHTPVIYEEFTISTRPPWLDTQYPFWQHKFTGANVFMLRMLRDYADELGVTASTENFNSNIAASENMLKTQSIELSAEYINHSEDTSYLEVKIKNLTGHKFPTGYPSRRVFVEVLQTNKQGDTLFHSGKTDKDYELVQQNREYDPHRNIIKDDSETQIYETIMGDVNGNVTTVLLRAQNYLKDNRIPPKGFSTEHISYDTTAVAGNAISDNDYLNEQGSDIITYKIAREHDTDPEDISTTVRVWYQSTHDKWLEEMFARDEPYINSFKNMYENADKTPILIAEKQIPETTGREQSDEQQIQVFPVPSSGEIHVRAEQNIRAYSIFDTKGKMIEYQKNINSAAFDFYLENKGLYTLRLHTPDGKIHQKRIIILR